MHRPRRALVIILPLLSIALLLLSAIALRGFSWHTARLLAAPSGPAAPSVVVTPSAGQPTDTFTFSLTGFAAGEAITVSFTAPPALADLDIPAPAPLTTTVDETGAGSFALRPVDQGLMPGTWEVTFTGQTSGATQTASFELDPGSIPGCGC
jgi:hypothetical protein